MQFPTTHWSVLAQATLSDEAQGRSALDRLCRSYWKPIHDFVRFRGFGESEAEDLTQAFLLRLCERSVWKNADAQRGRFRSFLLGALSHFLADELDRRNAEKRGGRVEHVALDRPSSAEPAVSGSDVAHFDREWALSILEGALAALREESLENPGQFAVLARFLPGSLEPISLEEGARLLGLGLPAMKSQVFRIRGRFRDHVRQRVAVTVAAPHDIEPEMRHLGAVLMDRGTPF